MQKLTKAEEEIMQLFPVISKKEYSKFSLSKLISNYFEGSVNELVSFLVKENDITLRELERIKQELADKK